MYTNLCEYLQTRTVAKDNANEIKRIFQRMTLIAYLNIFYFIYSSGSANSLPHMLLLPN